MLDLTERAETLVKGTEFGHRARVRTAVMQGMRDAATILEARLQINEIAAEPVPLLELVDKFIQEMKGS